ncbi:MAG: hypothetical protein ACOZQL_16015 [Myxococcota bacterium]
MLAAVAAVLLAVAPPLVTTEGVALEENGKAPFEAPFFGVHLDAGAPDGIGAGMTVTPGRFLRIQLSGLTNGVGSGVRLGAMLVAFPSFAFRPFLGVDGGYVWGGQWAWLPQLIDDPTVRSMITGVSVGFASAQVGFELGSKNFAFVLRAGLSYVDLGLPNQQLTTGSASSVSIGGLALHGFIPSARLGFLICFG